MGISWYEPGTLLVSNGQRASRLLRVLLNRQDCGINRVIAELFKGNSEHDVIQEN